MFLPPPPPKKKTNKNTPHYNMAFKCILAKFYINMKQN